MNWMASTQRQLTKKKRTTKHNINDCTEQLLSKQKGKTLVGKQGSRQKTVVGSNFEQLSPSSSSSSSSSSLSLAHLQPHLSSHQPIPTKQQSSDVILLSKAIQHRLHSHLLQQSNTTKASPTRQSAFKDIPSTTASTECQECEQPMGISYFDDGREIESDGKESGWALNELFDGALH